MRLIKHMTEKKGIQRGLLVYAAIFSVILFFAIESLNPTSTAGLMAQPFANFGIIMLSALFILLASAMVFTFVGSVFWAYALVSAVLGVGYIVNSIKLIIAGQVFVPTDLMIAREAAAVAGFEVITIERVLILRILLVALLHLPLLFLKFCPDFQKRFVAFSGVLAAFLLFFATDFSANRIMPAFGIKNESSLTALYRDVGFIMGFHRAFVEHNARSVVAFGAAQTALDFFGGPLSAKFLPSNNPDLAPNVIVIMSESFMLPTDIYNLEFSVEPAANFSALAKEHISANVVVPVFGGRTANTEFEFLTGAAQFFMGSAYYIPYNNIEQYFFRDINTAMPHLFRENGYRTVALHPYQKNFYNRDRIYPRLGFDEYICSDSMPNAIQKGWYISDESFTDAIIEQIIYAQNKDTPLFLFGVSMQNHWELWGSKYQDWPLDITAQSHKLSDYELGTVNSFLQGIYDADKQLGRLIDFIEQSQTPTIVVFFGDHMPLIGPSSAILEELGYISSQHVWLWNENDKEKMFTTPYLVWSNYVNTDEDWGTLSTFLLGARVLQHSGIKLNNYWRSILYTSNYFRGLTENHYIDIYGNFLNLSGVREKEHIMALQALNDVKWFGTNGFYEFLSQIDSE